MRETIAKVELTSASTYLLSLDFKINSTTSHTPTCSRYSSPTVSASNSNSDSNGCIEIQRLQSKCTFMSRVPCT